MANAHNSKIPILCPLKVLQPQRVIINFEKDHDLERTTKISAFDTMNAFKSSGLPEGGPVTNVTLPRNPQSTGRDENLTQLHLYLDNRYTPHQGRDEEGEGSEVGDKTTTLSCLIHGVGGVGKTEIALEYTYRCRRLYTHIFWLPSGNQGLLEEAFHGIFAKLHIHIENSDTLSLVKKVEMVHEWLQSTDLKWLLVFDNCEDLSTLRRFWPTGGRGAIIVTSRNPLLEQQQLDRLEDAEDIPTRDEPDHDWRVADIARAKPRLLLVLDRHNRPVESRKLASEVLQFPGEAEQETEINDTSPPERLDYCVVSSYGRTT
ncbi:hypothetical protein GGR51DRAFT_556779 [Nemania sp. FL0031]|nr:hypothetical protein GGR51DRAFT_556779 [Nemania sp. FL0031]